MFNKDVCIKKIQSHRIRYLASSRICVVCFSSLNSSSKTLFFIRSLSRDKASSFLSSFSFDLVNDNTIKQCIILELSISRVSEPSCFEAASAPRLFSWSWSRLRFRLLRTWFFLTVNEPSKINFYDVYEYTVCIQYIIPILYFTLEKMSKKVIYCTIFTSCVND